MKVDLNTLTYITGVLIPLAVAFVSKQHASSRVKAVLNAVLAIIAAIALQATHNKGLITQATVVEGFKVWTTGIVAYYGFHKPTGVAESVASVTADKGVG